MDIVYDPEGSITLTATLLTAGKSPCTDRIYSRESLVRAVEMFNEDDKQKFGEILDSSKFTDVPDLSAISHRVEKVWMEGDEVKASVQLLDTPMGAVARDLILSQHQDEILSGEMRITVKPSPVMRGTVSEVDGEMVIDDLELVRVDLLQED